ncbi:acetylgalactosaminyl-O-glycosyl-glycoprotein beta-1,3-N-acetylglucosaminyltransferase-like [Drosophila sulfurigaster albostrigata]|uniref:acetylgalactosaminyl-O-glycosyl-glycoprotein beta-1,3-N-acetylglucosaminyltransferase-like n=1 Tax=Drosophila sulfurigaster albostrigata TaxID=89887 RepID=UPI002D2187FC|nr:acetylgalactosaminyl-O-glycosyl-glycoprotein beta-1,3-N-acetylglucosaminyltransferase-like [Drosophila sulfurigaster albostrigata]
MAAVGSLHNTRILRFLLVLIVVILTIFIYASYSTTTTLTPTHIHAPAVPPPTPQQLIGGGGTLNNTGDASLSAVVAEEPSIAKARQHEQQQQQQQHRRPPQPPQHRLPTIDEDALLDGGAAGASPMAGSEQSPNVADEMLEEQQYVQGIDALTGNINSNGNNNNSETVKQSVGTSANASPQQQQQQQQQQLQQQQQSPSDAEILMIPTSNLQKFIENADKILKNMTSNSSNTAGAGAGAGSGAGVAASAVLPSEQRTDKSNQPGLLEDLQINLLDNNNAAAAPPAAASNAVMQVKPDEAAQAEPKEKSPPAKPPAPLVRATKAKAKSKPSAPSTPVDPSKGITTDKIYESGHLNEEIDLERICSLNGTKTRMLILITSAQTHADARMSIRQTWGHYGTRRDIGMAFVLGRGTNETVNQALTDENYMYGDLIRGNFIDSYNNLTLKTISSLEWADQHCNHAQYILKTDDDMFINVPKLLNFVKQLEKHKNKRLIFGRLAKKWKPIRNKKSKYYVSTDQFPAAVFPSFTTGPAYVMTGDIVHDLYVRSLKTVYLKLEDVFTTGIVAQSLGIERLHVNEFVNRRISFNPCNIRNAISVHMIKSNEQFDLWKKLLDQTTKCK